MTKQTDANARFTLWLDAELHRRFMLMCRNSGANASNILRICVEAYVETGGLPKGLTYPAGRMARKFPPLSIRETVPELDDEAFTFD